MALDQPMRFSAQGSRDEVALLTSHVPDRRDPIVALEHE